MTHLNDDQFAAALTGADLDPEAREHLDSCLVCRREITTLEATIEARRIAQYDEEPDWNRQKDAVLDRLPAHPVPLRRTRRMRPVFALAASLTLVLGIGALRFAGVERQPVATAEVDLEQILAETESLLGDDSIPGLWVADPVSDLDELETLFETPAS